MKPVLKWAGGKAKLAPLLASLMPRSITGRYIEPFIGGGALLLYLLEQQQIKQASISDQCEELINLWQVVRDAPEMLIAAIALLTPEKGWCEATYYGLRNWDRSESFRCLVPEATRAARFYILNKRGFNGLCRYNASGQFNVPWGKYKTPLSIPATDELQLLSNVLDWVMIDCCDFTETIFAATEGDFIYCDPPYMPIKKGGFTSYSGEWGENQQQSLFDCLQAADRREVKWMLSAAAEPSIKDLYTKDSFKVLDVQCVDVARSISCNGDRAKAKELIVRNYL
jgi:DNA adenine methylase